VKQIDLIYRTMIAELGQRLLDASFMHDFPTEGRFVPVTVKSRRYWYFDVGAQEGGQKRRYVGPADDPEIDRRVADFRRLKDDARQRRKMVSTLTREAGLIAAEAFTGKLVTALAVGGLFRLRACLVGTLAFQTYSAYLGIRLPMASILTGDADIAQDYAISTEVSDSLPSIVETLQNVDATFRAVPHPSGSPWSTVFRNANGYRVEFLTSNRGSDEFSDFPAEMPALGGAAAEPLRFLDYLIYQPVRSILLQGGGVAVNVPDPARYAVHKLIVAGRRPFDAMGIAKREKDLVQAAILFEALPIVGMEAALSDAIEEAAERGVHWRRAILKGKSFLSSEHRQLIGDRLQLHGLGDSA
jgi:hypothetical protein